MTTEISGNEASPNPFDAKQYWENRLGANPSLREVGYSMLGASYNKWLYKVRKAVLRRRVAALNLDLSRASVLDIGSGSGFYINFWKELGTPSVLGSDLTHNAVIHLRGRFPQNTFHELDIADELPPTIKGTFDIVSAFDVLFHITDDDRFRRAICNVAHLLRSGGVFCFTDLFLHRDTERNAHYVSRSLCEIERAVAAAGLEIIDRRPVFVLMNEPLDTNSTFIRSLWRVCMLPVRAWETLGALWGMALYPLDLVLTALLAESATTEIMVCRKTTQV
jgi:SAM-dependent methyltransferase